MNGMRRDLFSSSTERSMNTKLFESKMSPTRFNRNKKAVAPIPINLNSISHSQPSPNPHNQIRLKSMQHESATKLPIDAEKFVSNVETEVEFQSILRIRPFSLDEKGDKNLFSVPNGDSHKIRLHSLKDRSIHSTISRRQKDLDIVAPSEYHFDVILDDESTQDDAYRSICSKIMSRDSVAPLFHMEDYNQDTPCRDAKQHVIVSMGVSNSGKTYTMFGDEEGHDEGIVPRLFDDIFSSEKEFTSKKIRHQLKGSDELNFGLQLSMVHLHNDHIFDMLSLLDNSSDNKEGSSATKRRSNVSKMVASFESKPSHHALKELHIKRDRDTTDFKIHPTIITCDSPSDARTVLYEGLKNNTTTSTNLNKNSSRGHTMITVRPVLARRNQNSTLGDTITLIDMAGIERTKASAVSGMTMRESVSINTAISAMLQCLRSINNNHGKNKSSNEDAENVSPNKSSNEKTIRSIEKSNRSSVMIPYRQNKLTMLVQPLFSGRFVGRPNVTKVQTVVKILVSAYPGSKDYNEKKALLGEIDSLRGLKTHANMQRKFILQDSLLLQDSLSKRSVDILTSPSSQQCSNASNAMFPNNDLETVQTEARSDSSRSSPFKRIAKAVKTSSTKKRKDEVQNLLERIQSLEKENNDLLESYKSSKRLCTTLKLENTKLTLELSKSRKTEEKLRLQMKAEKQKKPVSDVIEQSFLIGREIRRREQTLLSSPLRQHMESVDRNMTVFCGNIQGRMVTKPPFQLYIPPRENEDLSLGFNEDDEVDDNTSPSSYSA